MRTMHRTLGLDAMLTRTTGDATRGSHGPANGGLDANVARYARTTFVERAMCMHDAHFHRRISSARFPPRYDAHSHSMEQRA